MLAKEDIAIFDTINMQPGGIASSYGNIATSHTNFFTIILIH